MQMQSEVLEGFQLSPQQRRLWLLQQDGDTFNVQCTVLLEGDLDRKRLERSLRSVAERHEILRTTFHRLPGIKIPVQVVAESLAPAWTDRDLSYLQPAEQQAQVEEILRTARATRLDYERGPLLHLSLITLSSVQSILLVTTPALCADAETLKNFISELRDSYAADTEDLELSDGIITYTQFAEWQDELLTEDVAGKEYWQKQMASMGPEQELPYQLKSTGATNFSPQELPLKIDSCLVQDVDAVARKIKVSTATFLLACWQTLLWRLTGQPEILVGVVYGEEKYEVLRGVLGPFAKILPASMHFEGDFNFAEILKRTDETVRDVFEWGEYLNSDSPTPAAIFEHYDCGKSHRAAMLSFSIEGLYTCMDQFGLKLSCVRTDQALLAELHYDANRFRAADVERLGAEFVTLLESVTKNPEAPVRELEILSKGERDRLLFEFNSTSRYAPVDKCFHELFEQQVERTPLAMAVQFEDQQLTYAQLNERANQLARCLRRRGAGPEKLVAIYLERSVEMIVSLLGILKSGAAYVSLDTGYPKERVRLLLAQANEPLIVTAERLKESLPAESKVICIDSEWEIIGAESNQNPDNLSTTENLVYVLFTSGSTGQPKGVAIEHRQLVNYLEGIGERFNLATGGGFATVSTLSADLGNTVIYLSLCTGGCLHVISQDRITDAEAMADYMSSHKIDCLKIVPSHLEALLTASQPERILPRQCLVLGGEASREEWIAKLQSLNPDCAIFNHYGPTETTVGVATFKVSELQSSRDTQTLPIGRPLSGTQIYLLDPALRLVPIGMPGEICVGGAGLARGYLSNSEATAEKFIPNIFGLEPGERLYRTGDLARHLPNGQIEFLGRADHQVKIRGFRIELGEIETVLTTHEFVRQCVLSARKDSLGNKQLVAYVVAERDAALTISQLRDYLKERLPDYMMPAAFVVLDELPLTRNGKVDRDALPAPEQAEELGPARGPSTWCEELLVELWAEVLHLNKVNTNANFFDLGGHSLLATQLISRIREVFRVEMPLRSVFDEPTVAGLAKRIETARRVDALGAAAGELKRVSRTEPMPLSFAQQRLWFLSKLEPENPLYNTRHVVMLTGRLDVDALQKAMNEVVRRHEILRTTFKEADGMPVQIIAPYQPSTLAITDLTALDQESQELQVRNLDIEEGNHSFDLAEGPLFRATLLKLSSEKHVTMFTTHHIISDFWSMGVLVREVAQLYSAFVKGESSPLPELEIQYADFAYWQRRWLHGESLEAELDFWKRQLADAPPTLDLPTDRPRPVTPSFQSETYCERLSPSLTAALKSVSRHEGATIFMTVLAAFKALLYFYTRQEDISVGTPIAGRNRGEVEDLIGCFLNTLVLRTQLSGDPDFSEMLRRVREVTLDAYTHQDLPFERLVQEIQPKRDLNRTPLFQALMVFHNNLKTSEELPELTLTSLGIAKQRSNFDLTLWVTESTDELHVTLEYNTDLFDRATIGNMVERFRMVLESAAANPELRLSEMAVLNESERHQILVEWNNTRRPYPSDSCFQQLFEAQAARTPGAIAVSCEGQSLTYQQLNQRSNQLARVLASQGVGPDVVVALLMDRGLDLMTTILAVFKAGGAYLPLDTRAPGNRLRQVITQSATPLVLASSSYMPFLIQALEELPAEERPPIFEIEEMLGRAQEVKDDAQEENLPLRNSPHSLAYVIYTSGSTGVPKGAMIEQRGMINHLYAKIDDLALTATDKVAQTASQSFDISVWQMLAALVVGGQVEIIGDTSAHDAGQLLPEIEKERVTIIETVPSMLRAMLDAVSPASVDSNLPALRWMIPTGEALSPDLCRRWLAAYPHAWLLNAYGPTECSDDVSHHPIHEVTAAEELNVPIGRPVGNTRLYIVDQHLRALPVGVPGELCVGGIGVGRGYLREPARTSEVFVPDPFSEEGGGRLYRTGDLACWRADGTIQFLGRIDYQVKIRGYRIEPAEIAVVLEEHKDVAEALVTVREDIPGNKRLVAYVVAGSQSTPVAGELRDYLKDKLPEYMLPSAFVMLDEMPLTPNGKIDRRALPAPDTSRPETTRLFVAPRNATEETLAGIVAKVLNLQQVGVHDDFFELGGHSLLATQVISRLREAFYVDLPLREIFEHPTIGELAQVISRLQMQQMEKEEREVMESIDQLSEEEVEAMLAQQLS
jgi:amino acid adenylation domain-containing protein